MCAIVVFLCVSFACRGRRYVWLVTGKLETTCTFEFIVSPIVHPRFYRNWKGPSGQRSEPLTRSDMLLSSSDWSSIVVGKTSPWLKLDSEDPDIRKNSERALLEEIRYASHLSHPAVVVNLRDGRCHNLARFISEFIQDPHSNMQVWIRLPTITPHEQITTNDKKGGSNTTPWHWWNTFRTLCENSKQIGLALELTADLPDKAELDRWCGEPVRAVFVPTSVFLTNKRGFPVLSKCHQTFLQQLYKINIQPVLSGFCRHSEKGIQTYHQYINHLYQTMTPPDEVELFGKGYEDFLQNPLQPLMDNLESQTYEVFEKDPVKYTQYQKAIYFALVDRVSDDQRDTVVSVVMVVGAGRGPLVRAALAAAERAERLIKIYAVEKNPNAIITLRNMTLHEWKDKVTIISSDMRDWKAPEKADILVSELLGSFSDNELSPECLDGAQLALKDDGISIPSQYASYVAPLCAPKLHTELAKGKESDYETPYVVMLRNVHVLAEPQRCFTFSHPNWGDRDNNRYGSFTFLVGQDSCVHGIAGYFDAVLYGSATISTVPSNHSPGMFSWFPIYFPFKTPVYVTAGSHITVHFWRRCSRTKVWYEWCMSAPVPGPLHNPNGRSYAIGL
ncbi:protein arginine N-methyltransferase 5-like isoform X2 [Corticium candelabrum]|uniref:protein arginine N-methyltransferase 5-like isoform X2 n=1 Tax=Corticium candelabrum TaxID=121492 RepID=UPI002E25B16D|nr:protein arginine N-methyltransferase 5-like isoform X2 [Corticium candelabrum]